MYTSSFSFLQGHVLLALPGEICVQCANRGKTIHMPSRGTHNAAAVHLHEHGSCIEPKALLCDKSLRLDPHVQGLEGRVLKITPLFAR